MGLLDLQQVWQNLIGLVVVVGVFYVLYKNMKATKFKRSIDGFLKKIKEND